MATKKNKDNIVLNKLRNITLISTFFGLLKKNIMLILRSKSSAMIILLGPLIIIFLVGAAFNTSSLFNIKIGTFSGSYSDISNSLIKELGDKQFQVLKLGTKEECISELKNNNIHVCTIFPNNLQIGSNEDIEFYVDNSKINLVWVIIDTLSTRVSTKSSELGMQLAGNLLDTLTNTEKKLNEKKSTINNIGQTNQDIETKFNDVSAKLDLIDLGFKVSDIGVDKISNKLDSVIKNNGYNKSLFEEVDKAIKNSIKSAKDYEKKINNTIAIKDELVKYIENANNLISKSTEGLKDLENTINLVSGNINNAKTTTADTIVRPIKTSINPIAIDQTNLNFLFPTLVVLIIMFIGLLLSSILIVRERLSNAYFRNFITPTRDWLFILSDYLTNLIILLIQLGIIFSVGIYFFKYNLVNVLLNSSILVFLLSTLFIFLGMLIGYLLKSEETVVMATFSIGSLFLFFSGTILPLETLPGYIKNIADFNPLVLGEGILKKIMIFNLGLEEIGTSLYLILSYIFVLILGVYFARKLSKRAI